MSRKIIGKVSVYYGSDQVAEERGERLDEGAKRRGFVGQDGSPELSPLFVYCFEFVDRLDPMIEAEAARLRLKPWEYVNRLFVQTRNRR